MIGRYRFLPKALWMAVRSGRFGPGIFEHRQFSNYHIKASSDGIPWQIDQVHVPDLNLGLHKTLRTTALVAIEGNQIIAEAYANGGAVGRQSNSFSMAKSIVATVVGICFRKGLMRPEDLLCKVLPELHDSLASICLQDLLQMSTGLIWDERPSLSSDNALAYYGNVLTKQILDLRAKGASGVDFEYVSVATQLLAVCIERSTGRSVQDWVAVDLWPKLGCQYDAFWNLDRPNGQVKAFCCFYATARDFARLGKLYLAGGAVQGQPLINLSFVEKAVRPSATFDPFTGRKNDCYGWHWWTVTHQTREYFYARGIRGQYVICCPATNRILVRLGRRRLPVSPLTGHPPDLYTWIELLNDV